MSESNYSKAILALTFIGTAVTVYALLREKKRTRVPGGDRSRIPVRQIRQPNRDANLGQPGKNRKFFGYSGQSSAQGSNAAGNPPPAVGLFASPRIIRPRTRAVISLANRPRPAYSATQNGKTQSHTIAAATPPYDVYGQ